MAYTLLRKIYDGVDGTNISEYRCDQYLLLMNLCEELGEDNITYKDIQNISDERELFGRDTIASSAIRTICPILFKFGFIRNYQKIKFPAQTFFTPAGKMFVKVLSAIRKVSDSDTYRNSIEDILINIKTKIIQLGLLNMASNYPDHKIWLLIYLLKKLKYISKNLYYYTLRSIQENASIPEALDEVKTTPSLVDDDYLREDGNPMDSTNYGYLTANLKNAGLVIQGNEADYFIPSSNFIIFCSILKGNFNIIPNTNLSLIYECN